MQREVRFNYAEERDHVVEVIHWWALNDGFGPKQRSCVRRATKRYPRDSYVIVNCAEYENSLACHAIEANWADRVASLDRALRLYYLALRFDSCYARAWEGVANVLDIKGRYVEGEEAARRAVKFGDDPCSVALLARIIAQRGKVEEAREWAKTIEHSQNDFAREIAIEVLVGLWDRLE